MCRCCCCRCCCRCCCCQVHWPLELCGCKAKERLWYTLNIAMQADSQLPAICRYEDKTPQGDCRTSAVLTDDNSMCRNQPIIKPDNKLCSCCSFCLVKFLLQARPTQLFLSCKAVPCTSEARTWNASAQAVSFLCRLGLHGR